MDPITPNVSEADIYEGTKREFEATPPGTYTMALSSISLKKTEAGEAKLVSFFTHVEPAAKAAYKGVNLATMLEGVDKNGKPKAKQTADLLAALGVAKEDIAGGNFSVVADSEPEAGAEWKGAPASIVIRGDRTNLVGRTAAIKVEANTFNGKTTTRGVAAYKA